MPYLTSTKRMWKDEGLEEGRQEGRIEMLHESIALDLELKFGPQGLE